MNIESAFPSTYLKASDLQGRTAIVTIASVSMETVGTDQKPILYFQGKQKGMVLNRTNANNISHIYGPNTEAWAGQQIELFMAMVDFQGKTVEAIRVRVPRAVPNARDRAALQSASKPAPATEYNEANPPPADVQF